MTLAEAGIASMGLVHIRGRPSVPARLRFPDSMLEPTDKAYVSGCGYV